MVKHQCRYCTMLVTGNGIWCGYKQESMSEAATKRRNKCKHFEFVELDAYGERDWEPDKITIAPQSTELEGQMRLELCV
ncbi:MAG: hypothetical protein IJ087_10365 [Eggerthellaceae bacterium]|nr:hypothetical protein [Eggerthellaceae bacterium]